MTEEAATAELDQAMGSAGSMDLTGVSSIFGAIDSAADGWYNRELEKQAQLGSDPCQFEVALLQILGGDQGPLALLGRAKQLAERVSGSLQTAIERSLANNGFAQEGVVNSEALSTHLVDNDFVTMEPIVLAAGWSPACQGALAAAGGPPFGLAAWGACSAGMAMTFLENWLPPWGPAVLDDPDGTNPPEPWSMDTRLPNGFPLGPGAWVWAPSSHSSGARLEEHIENGHLRGSAIQDGRASWTRRQILRVVSGRYTAARELLRGLAGDNGTGIPWAPGEEFSNNSKIAYLEDLVARYDQSIEDANRQCEEQRELPERIFESEQEQEDREREQRYQTARLALVLGFSAVGIFALRGRRR